MDKEQHGRVSGLRFAPTHSNHSGFIFNNCESLRIVLEEERMREINNMLLVLWW